MKLQSRQEKISQLLSFAKQFVGVPYKYGARMDEAPKFFDCSGFIKYVFAHVDITVPRSTIEQVEFVGKKVHTIKDIKPGDCIFVHGTSGHYNKKVPQGVGHVGIYLGEKKIIHASSRRTRHWPHKIEETGSVRIDTLTTFVKRSGPIVGIKRIA
ncbi:MAG: C40 family peptidase [Candidatus Paceibacterota bacterium]|jgi:cell wall-associated NlpC family hydrolase